MRIAAQVAQRKLRHPEHYCPTPGCLYRTGGGTCPRHQPHSRIQAAAEYAFAHETPAAETPLDELQFGPREPRPTSRRAL